MSIQSMRNWIKTHRVWIIVLFVFLVIGLVATYATSGMGNVGQKTATNDQTPEGKYKVYEEQIAASRTALAANPEGFAENRTLAGQVFESASVLMELNKNDEAQAAFKEAAVLFQKSLDVAPESLNDVGKSQIMLSIAGCKWMVGANDEAEALYNKALKLTPKDYGTNMSYIQYLYFNGRLGEAMKAATTYKDLLPEGDPNLEAVNGIIQTIQESMTKAAEDAANADKAGDKATTDNATDDGATK